MHKAQFTLKEMVEFNWRRETLDAVEVEPVFSDRDLDDALKHFRSYQSYARPEIADSHWNIEHVIVSSAGVRGWLDYNPDEYLRVGDEVYPADLCGLWARQALCVASEKPQWERVVLTVDSGASDTVVPPSVACSVPLMSTLKTGIEYEVANGGVVVNLGERRARVLTRKDGDKPLLMNFQVVKVHKPLLAVSGLVEAGHRVEFNSENPHIALSSGEVIPMKCNGGTYEIESPPGPGYVEPSSSGFPRQSMKR